jgi:hypothetical protein
MRTGLRAVAGVAADRGRAKSDRASPPSGRTKPSRRTMMRQRLRLRQRLTQRSGSKPRTSLSLKTNPRRNLASSPKRVMPPDRGVAVAVVAVRRIAAPGRSSRPKRL